MSTERSYETNLLDRFLTNLIIVEFFGGGPKDGHQPEIKLTDDSAAVEFRTWSPKRDSYQRGSHVSNKLYWNLTVQRTWETSVRRRGIERVEDHPILFARRLSTTRWETYEVVTLKRGAGFTATTLRGFVFRLGPTRHFHTDRKLGERRFKKAVRAQTLALLNNESEEELPPPPW